MIASADADTTRDAIEAVIDALHDPGAINPALADYITRQLQSALDHIPSPHTSDTP